MAEETPNAFGALAAQPQVGPPVGPEETQTRMAGWKTFLDRLQTDPVLSAGAMRFATQLMQQRKPGETQAGHFAGALEHSIDYTAAARAQAEKLALDRMRAESTTGLEGARTAQTQEETTQGIEKHPLQVRALQESATQAGQKTALGAADVERSTAEGVAGLRTPERIGARANTEDRGKSAKIRLDEAHARYYDNYSRLMLERAQKTGPGVRQVLHSTKIDNEDGSQSIVNSHAVDGKLYLETYTPPRFTNETRAREEARKEVDRITPFFGKAPYTGTKEEETARRVKGYMKGQRTILGPGGKELTPEEFDKLDSGETPTTPSPKPQLGATQRQTNQPIPVVRGTDGRLQLQGASVVSTPNAPTSVPGGTAFEAAQQEYDSARELLSTYGLRKRREDASGYEIARKAVVDAKKKLDAARRMETPDAEAEVASRKMPLRSY